jgi:Tol biopolymer transport system component
MARGHEHRRPDEAAAPAALRTRRRGRAMRYALQMRLRLPFAVGALIPLVVFACTSGYGATPDEPKDAGEMPGEAEAADADDAAVRDVAIDAPVTACDPTKPFGAAVVISELADPAFEGVPRLSPDEKAIYFASARGGDGGMDIYTASRGDASGAFGAAVPLASVSSPDDENAPFVTATGRTLLFGRTGDLWITSRASTIDPFEPPVLLGGPVNGPALDESPYLDQTEQVLYFASSRDGVSLNLYRTALANGTTGPAVAIDELNTSGSEEAPALAADGLTIYWASTRTDVDAGAGSAHIWMATRGSVSAPFAGVQPVDSVNSSAADYVGWISLDGCRLYLTSNRLGNFDIYVATKPH